MRGGAGLLPAEQPHDGKLGRGADAGQQQQGPARRQAHDAGKEDGAGIHRQDELAHFQGHGARLARAPDQADLVRIALRQQHGDGDDQALRDHALFIGEGGAEGKPATPAHSSSAQASSALRDARLRRSRSISYRMASAIRTRPDGARRCSG